PAIDTSPTRRHTGRALRLLSLALLIGAAGFFVVSCKRGGADAKPADVDYYTCTMHPSVRMQHPTDKCPIFSMDLTPVKKQSQTRASNRGGGAAPGKHADHAAHIPKAVTPSLTPNEDRPAEFSVPLERQQQIGVTYATIERRRFSHTIR